MPAAACKPPAMASGKTVQVYTRVFIFFMFLLKFDVFFVEIHRNETDLNGVFVHVGVASV